MDINSISTIITNVGFPILCCYVLYKQNSELTQTITKLTTTLQIINERIGVIEDKLEIKKGEE